MPKKPQQPAEAPKPDGDYAAQYNLRFNVKLNPIDVELYCFLHRWSEEQGGLGRYGHFKKAVQLLWPKIQWNEWLDDFARACTGYNEVGMAGCGSSGKTFGAALYGAVWWLANSRDSAVIFTSTSVKMIRKRVWNEITRLWSECPGLPGNLVDSKTMVQADRGDDRHAIMAKSVALGDLKKSMADIQGLHCKRILLIIDEATDTPKAIFEVISNLRLGCSEFQVVVIGNPDSRFDPHGNFCTPKAGWSSVDVDTEEWETATGGLCIRFDGTKSPNVRAGRTLYPFLYTNENLETAKKNEGINDPKFWKYTRGFWAPDGISGTVISDTLFTMFFAGDVERFYSQSMVIGGLDPSRGGDRCVLKLGKLGNREDGSQFLLQTDTHILRIDAGSKRPPNYQVADQVKEICTAAGCLPENLAVDATGDGAGFCDTLSVVWSPKIHRVSFGEVASDRQLSEHDTRTCYDVYDNRVTELWYEVKKGVQENMIRGMDIETMREFTTRKVFDERRKLSVEPKPEMKLRTGKSPDLADSFALMFEIVRMLGSTGQTPMTQKTNDTWTEAVKKADSIYTCEYGYMEEFQDA